MVERSPVTASINKIINADISVIKPGWMYRSRIRLAPSCYLTGGRLVYAVSLELYSTNAYAWKAIRIRLCVGQSLLAGSLYESMMHTLKIINKVLLILLN